MGLVQPPTRWSLFQKTPFHKKPYHLLKQFYTYHLSPPFYPKNKMNSTTFQKSHKKKYVPQKFTFQKLSLSLFNLHQIMAGWPPQAINT